MSRFFLAALLLAGCDREAPPMDAMPDMPGMPGMPSSPSAPTADPSAPATADPEIAYWTCPMHTSVRATGPGNCPICGMTLQPVTHAEIATGGVTITAERRALGGIATTPAVLREMRTTLREPAVVAWDPAGLADVTLKVDGYVRDARVVASGAAVRRGETLLTLYAPELLVAQEELLAAVAAAKAGDTSAADRVTASRRRLRLWDMTDAQIDGIVASDQALDAVPVLAPVTGRVIEADVVAGQAVMRGARLYRIGSLDRVWVEAQVPESELVHVKAGQPVRVVSPQLAEPRDGTVWLVLPGLDAEARTGTVRIRVANPDGALLPDAWATVEIDVQSGSRVAVPEAAIVYTGPRRVVFVDAGEDRLVPRTVRVGMKSDGWVEIVEGLTEGEQVVASGNFLVGADSRIQNGEEAW